MKLENQKKILNCAKLCDYTYSYMDALDPKAVINQIMYEFGVTETDFQFIDVPSTSTQAILLNTPDHIYLAFLGSESIGKGMIDWFINGFFELKSYHGGHAHKGFLEATDRSLPVFLKAIEALIKANPDKPMIITGHSLGGAMALFYAINLEARAIPVDSLITFCQPRCGNIGFVNSLKFTYPYLRIVNEDDVVPNVPPPYGKNTWSHAGRCYSFSDDGKLKLLTNGLSDSATWVVSIKIILSSIWIGITSYFEDGKINMEALKNNFQSTDHSMHEALSRLQKYFAKQES